MAPPPITTAVACVDAVVDYDEGLLSAARSLFSDDTIDRVQAFTRIVGDEVYVRGFNTASLSGDVAVAYDTWYEIGDRGDDLAFDIGAVGRPGVQS